MTAYRKGEFIFEKKNAIFHKREDQKVPSVLTSYYGHKSIYHPVSRELIPIHLCEGEKELNFGTI